MAGPETVSRLLDELEQGSSEAFEELFAVVYDELRAIARRQRRRGPEPETLNTTAVVHEAYLKLAAGTHPGWTSKAHFLAAAAKAIRHILLNYARDQRAQKRGGQWRRVSLDAAGGTIAAAAPAGAPEADALISVDAALQRLATESERLIRIVECRFFGGMTIEETAFALNLSTATVTRGWATAQAWLYRELSRDPGLAPA